MNESNIIQFDPKKRILEKAETYAASIELFLEEQDTAVPLLLKALKYADNVTANKIIVLLGSFAKQEVALPFYQILSGPNENEEIRQAVSIQLSVIFPFLKNPQPLIDKLIDDIKSPNPILRMHAAFALGWKGNNQAAIPLIELLYDVDTEVQQTAVNALSNLRDDRILNLMLERLENGTLEQQKCILFNLWRFSSKRKEVITVYLKYLEHDDADLRYDSLALLGVVSKTRKHLPAYHKCLKDSNPRIRSLALERLGEIDGSNLLEFKDEIHEMLTDPDLKVKQEVIKILKKIDRGKNDIS